MQAVGDSQVVLIGEASHGTHEFYAHRAELTRRLIEERGFTAVALEADWPDAYRVNRFVQQGRRADPDAAQALGDFRRFPLWMWRNQVMLEFVRWLRDYNASRPPPKRCALYGLDLYSMYSSMEAVIRYLEQVSPVDAENARKRYSRFDRFQGDPQEYGFATSLGITQPLRDECVRTLLDLQHKGEDYLRGEGGLIDGDELFYAQQNASLVANAEEYYRQMFQGDAHTWNLRDTHMANCLSALMDFHAQKHPGHDHRFLVWAHNSHLGDSAATEVSKYDQLNLGHLLRRKFRTFSVGFSTYAGTVTAAPKWEMPAQLYTLRPGAPGSWEAVFHEHAEMTGQENFSIVFRSNSPEVKVSAELVQEFSKPRLERYVGVIYRPDTEKASHYVRSRISQEYDALIYLDRTHALQPMDMSTDWLTERHRLGNQF
jgi:erythromycin esterase-like protein